MNHFGTNVTLAVAIGALFGIAQTSAAAANRIAHQPADMRFTPPAGLNLTWECLAAGSGIYGRARGWTLFTLKVTNEDVRPIQALKTQADFLNSFGDSILSVPISENASIGQNNVDAVIFAFQSPLPRSSIANVNFSVLAGKILLTVV